MANSTGPESNGPLGFDPTVIDVAVTAGAALPAAGISQIGPRYALGTIVADRNGTSYMYVKNTGAAIAQYTWCTIDETFAVSAGTRANATKMWQVGIPQMSGGIPAGSTTNQFCWVFCGPGAGSVLTLSATTSLVPLYTSTSTGLTASVAANDYRLMGARLTAAGPASASGAAAIFADQQMWTWNAVNF